MKKLLAPLLMAVLVLTGCGSATTPIFKLPLTPVPLIMKVDSRILAHLVVSVALGDYAKQAKKAGALTQSIVYYVPSSGPRAILMVVYEFPTKTFDRLQNPKQPPAYGQEVIRKNGEVFSIAGPQDSIFDPKSQDGKNVATLYATMFKPSTYSTK